jgi:hypothetical protein
MPAGVSGIHALDNTDHSYRIYLHHLPQNMEFSIDSRETWEDLKARYGV